MKEVTFLNRVPTYPGRVVLTPVSGQANTFDMVRADGPIVEGTPLDKATFESVIHSRLTGRYYVPTVTQSTVDSQTGIMVNPVPTSWSGSGTAYTSGNYKVTASQSATSTSYAVPNALDGNDSTYLGWYVQSGSPATLTIELPSLINVKKVKLKYTGDDATTLTLTVQGSTDGAAYTNIYTRSGESETLTEYTITNPGLYKYYRFSFSANYGVNFRLYTVAISNYDITTHRNNFSVASGMPVIWDEGQRVMLETPANVNTVGVVRNTLNGVTVNTILQPNKRYELRYTGSAFVAKEV